jgi:4-hydroxythreonine-4-phosphate dehydrogenase
MKKIAITMGEPGGVGPEVIVKAMSRLRVRGCILVVVGNAGIMRDAVKLTELPLQIKTIENIRQVKHERGIINVLNIPSRLSAKKRLSSKSAGTAVVKYIRKAVELALNHEVDAIVTAPVSKESLKMAGHPWPGHTELLAELTGAKKYAMMFVSDKLKLILCTIHIPLKDVPKKITKSIVAKTIGLGLKGAAMTGKENARIAVAGLNPHAGESGIMGSEEAKAILPSIDHARSEGINVSGPYPPDVIFYKALKGECDIVVCMYHDQGLIPFKMLSFDSGVNVTVGLPIIRTSPDHGTAFDIAWQNKANPKSMIEAIKLAARMHIDND